MRALTSVHQPCAGIENKSLAFQRGLQQQRREIDDGLLKELPGLTNHSFLAMAPHDGDVPGVVCVPVPALPESPAACARRLAVITGVANSMDQYETTMLAVLPLQQLWEFAASQGRLIAFDSRQGLQLFAMRPGPFVEDSFVMVLVGLTRPIS